MVNEQQPKTLAVGQPFPGDLVDHAAYWDTSAGMIVISNDHLPPPEDLAVERIWLTHAGPVIGIELAVAAGFSVDLHGMWQIGHPRPPILDAERGQHVALTVAWVENTTKVVVHLAMFTLSPHASEQLVIQARRAWAEPLGTVDEMLAAAEQWNRRHPDDKAVRKAAFASSRPGA